MAPQNRWKVANLWKATFDIILFLEILALELYQIMTDSQFSKAETNLIIFVELLFINLSTHVYSSN